METVTASTTKKASAKETKVEEPAAPAPQPAPTEIPELVFLRAQLVSANRRIAAFQKLCGEMSAELVSLRFARHLEGIEHADALSAATTAR